jgi:parallel beta-helix repeat protein
MDSGTEAAEHAMASEPDCGTILTRSTKLRRDIGLCNGDGLILAKDGITLDCDGHSLTGIVFQGGRGVVVDGVAGVTVKNCRIDGFWRDIELNGSIGATVRDNELTGDNNINVGNTCMHVEASTADRIAGNLFSGCLELLQMHDSYAATIEENVLEGGFDGVFMSGVNHGHRIRDNAFNYIVAFGSGPAVALTDEAVGNRIDQNEIEHGGTGIWLRDDSVRGNVIENNHIDDTNTNGIHLLGGTRNVFRYNEVEDSNWAAFEIEGGTRNLFRGNEAEDNGTWGFHVLGSASEHVFDGNEACGNGTLDAELDPSATDTRWFDNDFCTEGGL